MIFVDRNAVPPPTALKNAATDPYWRLANFFERQERDRGQETPPFQPDVWRANDVPQAIQSLFSGKCAFCESLLTTDPASAVGHFRPIERASDLDGTVHRDHYWWLAYEWSNLYTVCGACSRAKSTRFPIAGKRAVIDAIGAKLSSERPLLLDPCERDDHVANLIEFLADGSARGADPRAKATIEVFALNRTELMAPRRAQIERVISLSRTLANSKDPERLEERGFVRLALASFGPTEPYFAAMRQQARREYVRMASYTLTRDIVVPAGAKVRFKNQPASPSAAGPEPAAAPGVVVAPPKASWQKGGGASAGAVWLDKIQIENFKALRHLELTFPRTEYRQHANTPVQQSNVSTNPVAPWIMLLGENGVGKSSVLKAIALTLMPRSDRARAARHSGEWVSRGRGARWGSIRLHFSEGEPVELRFKRGDPRPRLKSEPPSWAVLLGYGSTRLLPPTKRAKPRPERIRVDNLFNAVQPLRNAERWIADRKVVGAREFDMLAMSLKTILSLEREDRILRRAGELSARVFDALTPIRELSDGYQSVLALAMDMMLNLSHATFDMQGVEGLVLLDEIETHMHPRWKIAIVSALRNMFPHVQFIATTHDPLCVQGLNPGELYVMARHPKTLEVHADQVDVPPGSRADQILTGAWFGLPSTRDPQTLALMNEHSRLLLNLTKSPEQAVRQAELERILTRRISEYAGTAVEQLGLQAAAEVEAEQPPAQNTADREQLRDKILERLRQKRNAVGGG